MIYDTEYTEKNNLQLEVYDGDGKEVKFCTYADTETGKIKRFLPNYQDCCNWLHPYAKHASEKKHYQ